MVNPSFLSHLSKADPNSELLLIEGHPMTSELWWTLQKPINGGKGTLGY